MTTLEEYRAKIINELLKIITKEQHDKISPMLDKMVAPSIFASLLDAYKDNIETMYHSISKEIGDIIMEDFIAFLRDIMNPPKEDDGHE
jgi:hypothetical protein